MLKAIPKEWFLWNFNVMDGTELVAEIDLSLWRTKGLLTVEGEEYGVYREGLVSGDFILESAGSVLARAVKPSALTRTFFIEHADKHYRLVGKSALSRQFLLLDGPEEIGTLSPEGLFTRRARVDLPEHLPLPVRVFIIWLAVIVWKRDSG